MRPTELISGLHCAYVIRYFRTDESPFRLYQNRFLAKYGTELSGEIVELGAEPRYGSEPTERCLHRRTPESTFCVFASPRPKQCPFKKSNSPNARGPTSEKSSAARPSGKLSTPESTPKRYQCPACSPGERCARLLPASCFKPLTSNVRLLSECFTGTAASGYQSTKTRQPTYEFVSKLKESDIEKATPRSFCCPNRRVVGQQFAVWIHREYSRAPKISEVFNLTLRKF